MCNSCKVRGWGINTRLASLHPCEPHARGHRDDPGRRSCPGVVDLRAGPLGPTWCYSSRLYNPAPSRAQRGPHVTHMSAETTTIDGEEYRKLATVEVGDDMEAAIREVQAELKELRGKYILYSRDPWAAGFEGAYNTEEEAMERLHSISYDATPGEDFCVVRDGEVVFGKEPPRAEFAVAAGNGELAIVAK